MHYSTNSHPGSSICTGKRSFSCIVVLQNGLFKTIIGKKQLELRMDLQCLMDFLKVAMEGASLESQLSSFNNPAQR